jgi:TetR/AcrR family transcriptional repressor of nem operon
MGRISFLRLLEPDASIAHVRAIFDERIEGMCNGEDKRGCMLCHTAMELAPHDDEIEEVLQKFMQRMSKAFAIGLENARQKGEVRETLDTEKAGEFLTGALFGMTVMARAGFARKTLYSYVDSTLESLTA